MKVEEILSRQVDYDFCKGCGSAFLNVPGGHFSERGGEMKKVITGNQAVAMG